MTQRKTGKVEPKEPKEDDYEYIPEEDEYDEGEEEGGMLDKILGICPITALLGKAVDQVRDTIEDLVSCNK